MEFNSLAGLALLYDSAMGRMRFHHADVVRGPQVRVIAEIGVNHDGSTDLAKRLMDAALEAGADAVKFQCFDPATLLSGDGALAAYQSGKASDARSMLAALRLTRDDFFALREHARQSELAFVVTPFSVGDVALLADLEVDAVKIASPDAVNPWLLEAAAGLDRPMWVSTGTCDLDELKPAAALLRGHHADSGLLHCVSAYPTPVEAAQLGGIAALRTAFGLPTGYSDHTRSTEVGGWAVAAGACILEKHLTHDRHADGPDHAASLEPYEFASYITNVRQAAAAQGATTKTCTDAERDVRVVSRQSLAYARDLPAGHVLERDDLETRRPGTGVAAAEGKCWIGRRLTRSVIAGTLAEPQDTAE